ncbi:MAG: dihydrofolate reductase family protein [Acidimicrobiales bacterium]
MRTVTYSMGMTLDGYITGPDGGIGWSSPSDELFRSSIDEVRGVDVHLLGRNLYEAMLYWDDPEQEPGFGEAEHEWADLWNALPKVVFSTTLTSLEGKNHRLATGTLAEEIERLRDGGDGQIAIGGATLAAEAIRAGLVDEYRIRIHPVLVGGGRPYFPPVDHQVDLELVETRTFPGGVVLLRHRVPR